MNTQEQITYIKKHFPITSTEKVASDLNLTSSMVRTIARNNNVKKCNKYLHGLKSDLVTHRRKWYQDNIPDFTPTTFQEQIIFGSLLGDGYISKGADRSINFSYQEHFGESQREYREWKLSHLHDLGFSINGNYLRSISHPYFTNLHPSLYSGEKVLTDDFISKCNHPIFLTSLYLDDGSLMLSYQYNKRKHTVHCHPSIVLYTLNLTRPENEMLASHLNATFGLNFVVSGHPDGKGTLLKINKEKEVSHLLNVLKPYTDEIPSMLYKTNLQENFRLKQDIIKKRYGEDVTIILSSSDRRKLYTKNEINLIIDLKKDGQPDQTIANRLGRTYWSVVYKISELRKEDLL